ncbi:MAG: hypothetical protein K6C94_02660 [Candidatus Gastranaerophilales bacterium]|nr:hypothetical protein [Candidatus Gastranaerophilales bacterium]
MKKIIFSLFLIGILGFPANAKTTPEQVKAFFNSYVQAANNFDPNLFQKYYIPTPKIIRVVEKKDGTTQSVNVPLKTYLDEAAKGQKVGKMLGYKNNYSNIQITPQGKDFKVSATRLPSPGGKYAAYFVIGEDANGKLKIKVESMNTPRQEFLKN